MPPTTAQLRDKYLGPIKDAYAAALVWRLLTNRRFEGDAQNAYELKLTTSIASAFDAAETDRAGAIRNPSLPVSQELAATQDTLTMRYVAQHVAHGRNPDLLEGPADQLPVALREQAYKMAQKSDRRVRSIVLAGIPNAQDGENSAGYRLGGDQMAIDDNGEPLGTDDNVETLRMVIRALRRVGHVYRASNYWRLGDPAYDERTPYALMHNSLWSAVNNYVDAAKPSNNLVDEFFRSDGVQPTGVVASIAGIPIVVTNEIDKVAVGGKNYLPLMVTNPAAVTAAFRTPDVEFETGVVHVETASNTWEDFFGWRAAGEAIYGAEVVNPGLLFRFLIRNAL
ncbi:MAG: hypothetical protein OXE50_02215 [Chloroflexi bacterium]|nr:hypothetical protein [Chloroflexota bacterium]